MSLMTQSLKRLAEAQAGRDVRREAAAVPTPTPQPPPTPQPAPESRKPVQSAVAEAEPVPSIAAPPAAKELPNPEPAERTPRPELESADRPQPRYVLPAIAELRTAILNEIGQPESDGGGKVVVLVSLQADKDTKAASTALTCALVGTTAKDVLSLDAAPPTARADRGEKKSSTGKLHGFTSLMDGTRDMEDVVVQAGAPGLAIIPSGLDKGGEQAVDPSAVERALANCRKRFAFTVVNGGPWESKFLPHVAHSSDAVYLVVRANVTEQETAKRAVKSLDGLGLPVRGCILAGKTAL